MPKSVLSRAIHSVDRTDGIWGAQSVADGKQLPEEAEEYKPGQSG